MTDPRAKVLREKMSGMFMGESLEHVVMPVLMTLLIGAYQSYRENRAAHVIRDALARFLAVIDENMVADAMNSGELSIALEIPDEEPEDDAPLPGELPPIKPHLH